VNLSEDSTINFDILTKNIDAHMKKVKSDLKYVVIFDNISTIPNANQNLIDNINKLVKFCSESVSY
jgi:hypothetical protein